MIPRGGKVPKSLEKQSTCNLVMTSQINLMHISWSCSGHRELKCDGYRKQETSLCIMLKYAAKATDHRAGEPVLCVPSGSQHSAGPVLEWDHGKERIWQLKVISAALKLVHDFLQSDCKSPFLSSPYSSELKTAWMEKPKILSFLPTGNHGVSIFPFHLLVLQKVDQFSQCGHSLDFCLPPFPPPMSWRLHTNNLKATQQEPSPPQGKVHIFCGSGGSRGREESQSAHSYR